MNDLLQPLNPAQREAAEYLNGPLLIIAGAGAGKTKTITYRIANLIRNGVAPEEILAVTFTNKAAREMRERVEALLAEEPSLNRPARLSGVPYVATFHALGVRMLRENAALINLPKHFAIFDRSDSLRAIKEALKQSGYDPKQFEPRKVLGLISRAKGDGISRGEYRGDERGHLARVAEEVWGHYERILKNEKALDFDDLLLETKKLLEREPSVLARYRAAWKYLHVDEYQDTNRIQDDITALLAGDSRNVCVVGDIDQNIYSWRGADIANLLQFEKRYPGTRTVILEENYRSTQTIIAASNTVIAKNKNRKAKNLFTKNATGEKILLYGAADEADEARFITERVQALAQAGVPFSEIAVLYRANFQSRILEELFLVSDIPYQVLGTRFFDRKEVKDVLSFIRLALNPESVADLKRVANVPPRGIGKVTLLKMVEGRESELSGKLKERVAQFRALMKKIQEQAETLPPSQLVSFVIKTSGLEEHFKNGSDEDAERLENIYELVALAKKYDAFTPLAGTEALLENAALASDQDALIHTQQNREDTVKLMTVHAAKGLEFDYVFITGLEADLFPHESADETRQADSEEERRLFYVALTRARKQVFLTFASIRTVFGSSKVNTPSAFLGEVGEEHLAVADEQAGGRQQRSGKTDLIDFDPDDYEEDVIS